MGAFSRPVIGITTRQYRIKNERVEYLGRGYMQAVIEAGGLPVLLPLPGERELSQQYLELLDGLLLSGGADIEPAYYNQERSERSGEADREKDRLEIALLEGALERELPVLAICRGMQLLNVFYGGNLYQDIKSQRPGSTIHSLPGEKRLDCFHQVQLTGGFAEGQGREGLVSSPLQEIYGRDFLQVNSLHHQGACNLGKGLKVAALAEDELVEAIYDPAREFTLGVQWHPEKLWQEEREHLALFRAFIRYAAKI